MVLYVPLLQAVQDVLPAVTLYRPEGHLIHEVADVVADAYWPAMHIVHVDDPTLLAFPTSHATQVSAEVARAVPLYRPATQSVHEEAAIVAEAYFPASQIVHTPTPASLAFPMSHIRQVLMDVAPSVPLYRPALQFMHEDAAVGAEANFPARQMVQVVAPMSLVIPTSHSRQVLALVSPREELYLPALHS